MNRPSHISAADWDDLSLYIPERDGPFMKDGQRMRTSLMMLDRNQRFVRDASSAATEARRKAVREANALCEATALADAAPPILHRPGAVRSVTSDAVEAAYTRRDKLIGDAWKEPLPAAPPAAPVIDTSAPGWRERLYAASDAALSSAWRTPA
jgi:hypothetical protein